MKHRPIPRLLGSDLALPLLCAGMWALMVLLFEVAKPAAYDGPGLCMFHNVTGVPCPTCGSTRAMLAIGRGQFVDAFIFNPFMMIAMLALIVWIIIRVFAKQKINVQRHRNRGWIVWTGIATLFVANWLYLIVAAG